MVPGDRDSGGLSSLVHRETVRAVTAAIESLTPEQREILVLRVFESTPFKILAAETGVSAGTLRKRLWDARAKLRSSLPAGILAEVEGCFDADDV